MPSVTQPAVLASSLDDHGLTLWVNQSTNEFMTETFTIIQRNRNDIWHVMAISHNLRQACDLAADYCNMNGVARTLVLNSMGQCVCVES
jgi:hypothetical protein